MNRKIMCAAVAFTLGVPVSAANVVEVEGNNTLPTAQNIDGTFTLDFDSDIGDTAGNTSTSIPHATIAGSRSDATADWFTFTVATAGSRGIFDVDYAWFGSEFFDSFLDLYTGSGIRLAWNDDYPATAGASGSVASQDAYLEYVFASAGTYAIKVSNCCIQVNDGVVGYGPINDNGLVFLTGNESGSGGTYELQVSLEAPDAIPEPETWAMLVAGFGMVGGAMRFRRQPKLTLTTG